MTYQDEGFPLHDDSVPHAVEQDLRDNGMIPANLPEWKHKVSESIVDLPSGQLMIERYDKGSDWKITTRFRNNGGCWCAVYMPGAESVEQAERDGPGLVATALELLARDIRKWVAAKETP